MSHKKNKENISFLNEIIGKNENMKFPFYKIEHFKTEETKIFTEKEKIWGENHLIHQKCIQLHRVLINSLEEENNRLILKMNSILRENEEKEKMIISLKNDLEKKENSLKYLQTEYDNLKGLLKNLEMIVEQKEKEEENSLKKGNVDDCKDKISMHAFVVNEKKVKAKNKELSQNLLGFFQKEIVDVTKKNEKKIKESYYHELEFMKNCLENVKVLFKDEQMKKEIEIEIKDLNEVIKSKDEIFQSYQNNLCLEMSLKNQEISSLKKRNRKK